MDLASLPEDLIKDLEEVGGKKFSEKVTTLKEGLQAQIFRGVLPCDPSRYRKLARVDDKEMKTRVIAILDYFSQSVLKPLHEYLFKVLRKIPQDRTFSQGDFSDSLKSAKVFYSVDLTAATDRFPITLIQTVLEGHFPTEYVSSWKRIMVDHPFWSPEHKKYISYAVGNPMGAYSS